MQMRGRQPSGARVKHCVIYLICLLCLCSYINTLAISEPSEALESFKIEKSESTATLEDIKPKNFFPMDQEYEIKPVATEKGGRSYNYSDVLLVYNGNSALSIKIAKYFQNARNIPESNMVNLTNISAVETVSRTVFEEIRGQIESYLDDNNLTNRIN